MGKRSSIQPTNLRLLLGSAVSGAEAIAEPLVRQLNFLGGAVHADRNVRIRRDRVRRNLQVLRRRHALEHTPGNVVLRSVARAVESARPALTQIRARELGRIVRLGRAAGGTT